MGMKRKRFLILALAILVVLALTAVLTACSHRHEVMKWRVTKEPTCTTEGMQRGACVDCGEVVEEPVPTVAENHIWGEWEVSIRPSFNRDGKGELKRVCRENAEHTQAVSIPKLSSNGAGYEEYEIFKEPTVVAEGRLSAVYASEYGNIAFTVNVPKKEFDEESVEDAVLMGSSNKDLIRKGSGVVDIGYNENGGHNYGAFNYVFGTDYTYTNYVGDGQEIWVSLTSGGDVFGVLRKKNTDGSVIVMQYPSASELDFNGFHYRISRADRDFYGAEGLLANAYSWGKKNANRDFKQGVQTTEVTNTSGNVVNPNGERVYWFRFGYYSVPQYFCKIECKFMLTESGALRYILMTTDTYVRDPGVDDNDKQNDQFYLQLDPSTNDTLAYLYENCGRPVYNEVVEYYQELKADYPDEPEHEYTEASFIVSDFDVTYKNRVVPEEYTDSTPTLMTGGGTVSANILVLVAQNVQPATAGFSYDPLSIYRITANGRYIKLDSDSVTDPVWVVGPDGLGRISIRSRLAGEIKLAFRTKSGCEKIVTIYANYSAPSQLRPAIYEYHDSGYEWKESTTNTMSATVYARQSLTMKSVIDSSLLAYVDGSYDATIASGPAGGTLRVNENAGTVSFTASEVGEYVVEMKSKLKPTVVAILTVTVVAPPSVDGLLQGEYTAKMKKFDAEISFAPAGKDGKIYATVTTNKGTEILHVYYDEEYRIVRSEHADGARLGVAIELNEAYKLVFANPTGFGSGKERAVMYEKEE